MSGWYRELMRWLWITALACGLAGCFSERTEYPSGVILCHRPTMACPTGLSCAVDGRCYRPGDGPRDAGPGDARTGCVENELTCSGRDQQRCIDNVFQTV